MGIQFAMAAESKNRSGEVLERLEHDMANLKDALGTLGLRPCSLCGKFYPSSDPGNLFTACGDSVCYACFSSWWTDHSQTLAVAERQPIEYKLREWLIRHHNARVFREFKDLPPNELQGVHIIVACRECKGSGRLAGERCRHCLANGTVWVVTGK
jgi:hypothetical protein